MRLASDKWGQLTDNFDITGSVKHQDSADNVEIAWPVIIGNLPDSGEVIDFGCGTGGFCHYLHELGFSVAGIDNSPGMLDVARKLFPQIRFYRSWDKSGCGDGTLDAVTCVMSLQFVQDVEDVLSRISKILKNGGRLIVATFNPDFISEGLKQGNFFSQENEGLYSFGDLKIPTYGRSEKEYIRMARERGLTHVRTYYPPFTQEFIEKYSPKYPTNVPEFMIMVFNKA